eukprot:GHVT01087345.1.p2 GENE.GHVT01087345.1~~GHVT01087345.1.p2  ORF type:complete len:313 (-),score=92.15 GHVT01087345.1:1437-2375(-)
MRWPLALSCLCPFFPDAQEPLRPPVVACRLGRLYNKERLLDLMVQKKLPPQAAHIKSLKDVTDIKKAQFSSPDGVYMRCPLSRVSLEGSVRSLLFWPCGCVAARRAVAQLKPNLHLDVAAAAEASRSEKEKLSAKEGQGHTCPVCSKPFDPVVDLIPLIPTPEEAEVLMERLRATAPSGRGEKTRKRKESKQCAASAATSQEGVEKQSAKKPRTKAPADDLRQDRTETKETQKRPASPTKAVEARAPSALTPAAVPAVAVGDAAPACAPQPGRSLERPADEPSHNLTAGLLLNLDDLPRRPTPARATKVKSR